MRTLYGTYSDNCCGFCKLHHTGVTPTQMKRKQCLEKNCVHFRKYKDHPHWSYLTAEKEKKQERKTLRKQRKAERQAYFEHIQSKAPLFEKSQPNTAPEPDYVIAYSTDDPPDLAVNEYKVDTPDVEEKPHQPNKKPTEEKLQVQRKALRKARKQAQEDYYQNILQNAAERQAQNDALLSDDPYAGYDNPDDKYDDIDT